MFACCKVNVDFQVTCKMYMYYEAICHPLRQYVSCFLLFKSRGNTGYNPPRVVVKSGGLSDETV